VQSLGLNDFQNEIEFRGAALELKVLQQKTLDLDFCFGVFCRMNIT
jgi:hypothetical protein